ncbi:hypothetical protein [Rhodococcus qingshengii]|uniref:hypothetical protein n=1 Tax=Rhodococcus qingshengii TaxID=334542 RepID=UPI00355BBA12
MPDMNSLGDENADGLSPTSPGSGSTLGSFGDLRVNGPSESKVIEQNGRPVAALVSMEDLRRL